MHLVAIADQLLPVLDIHSVAGGHELWMFTWLMLEEKTFECLISHMFTIWFTYSPSKLNIQCVPMLCHELLYMYLSRATPYGCVEVTCPWAGTCLLTHIYIVQDWYSVLCVVNMKHCISILDVYVTFIIWVCRYKSDSK